MNYINKFTIAPTQRQQIIDKLKSKNIIPIFDYVFEKPRTYNDYESVKNVLKHHLTTFPNHPLAVKLSATCDLSTIGGMNKDLQDHIEDINELHKLTNSVIYIDAEEIKTKQLHDYLIRECWLQNIMIGKTYQMYRKNEIKRLENDMHFVGDLIHYKIVRGAYWHTDKHTGELFIDKKYTDKQYDDAIELTKHLDNVLYATHNTTSLGKVPKGKKVAQLLGLKDNVSENMAHTHQVYKYVPFGNVFESVPYLFRRLHENMGMLKHLL